MVAVAARPPLRACHILEDLGEIPLLGRGIQIAKRVAQFPDVLDARDQGRDAGPRERIAEALNRRDGRPPFSLSLEKLAAREIKRLHEKLGVITASSATRADRERDLVMVYRRNL